MNENNAVYKFQENEGPNNFIFDEHPIRTSGTPTHPFFVAKDVCMALGIENCREALARIPSDEKGVSQTDTLGGAQEMGVVTEAGLYRLIFRSDKPEAKRFQDWVFKEVLPKLRRTSRLQWLQEAFKQGKTGKVQLTILHQLGIGAAPVLPSKSALAEPASSTPIDLAQFWTDVDQGFVAKPRPEAFRLRQRQDSWLLYLLPNDALKLARGASDAWWNVSRAELRAKLKVQSEWISQECRQRFGGARRTQNQLCWVLAVTQNSMAGLLKLTERLAACPERDKLMINRM